jgi:hypothetical protein
MDSSITKKSATTWLSAAACAALVLLLATPSIAQSRRLKLRPSKDYWTWAGFPPRPKPDLLWVPGHRRLASVGDTLYMLNSRDRILWTWSAEGGVPFTDIPIMDSGGTIYVIGYDLLWAAIDSETGRLKGRGTANGRATFSQIKLYRRNMYLVVTDMSGYRDSLRDTKIKDQLTLCSGNSILWNSDIPAGAELQVRNDQIFLVVRRKHRVIRQVIRVPDRFEEPIGRVGRLVDDE